MNVKKLKVELRQVHGSPACRRAREQGRIPAVAYAKDFPVVLIDLDNDEFCQLAERSYPSQVFEFECSDSQLNGKQVIVKEIQRDYLNAKVKHIDFQVLTPGKTVSVNVPLNVFGEPVGVKAEGGVLAVSVRTVKLKCLPKSIPEIINVDVSAMRLGDRIRYSDLSLPEGASLAGNSMVTVANVVSGRLSRLAAADGTEDKAA